MKSESRSERRTVQSQAPDVGAGGAQLPALRTVPEQAAVLATTKWGDKLLDLAPEAALVVYRVLHESFPDLGPVELNEFFDIIGNRIYDNAHFWLDRMARDDRCVRKPHVGDPLKPGSPEWDRWMRGQDPAGIVAAYVCKVGKLEATKEIVISEECGYSAVSDAILYEIHYIGVPGAKNAGEALKLGRDLVEEHAPGAQLDLQWTKQENGLWKVRYKQRRPDFHALAHKTARTRAARRVGKLAFSLSESKLIYAQKSIDTELLTAAAERQAGDVEKYTRQEIQASDSYRDLEAEPPTAEEVEVISEGYPEARVERPVAVGAQAVAQSHIRRVYALLEKKKLSGGPHVAFKTMIADVRGLDARDPQVLEKINPHEITYAELQRIHAILDRIPGKGGGPVEHVQAELDDE